MDRKRITPTVRTAAEDYLDKQAMAKVAESESNKAKTVLRNAIKADLLANEALPGSYYVLFGQRIANEASITDGIPAEHLYEQFKLGHITEEQFLRCIKVQVTETKNVLGGDVVAALSQPIVGKEVDVRVKPFPVDDTPAEGLYIAGSPKVARKKIGPSQLSETEPVREPVQSATGKRRIKVR